jgi:hypothetical protein
MFVDDEEYLRQLIAYIHLNPVTAGTVNDPEKYRWCGHREVVGKAVGRRLIDIDETLLAFHPSRRKALFGYRSAMSGVMGEDWVGEGPGRLPWWRVGRPSKRDQDAEIVVDEKRPRTQMDGLSNVKVRPKIELNDFLEKGAVSCDVTVKDLRSRKRRAEIVEAREVLAWLGVELYGFTVKEIAAGIEKYIETTGRLVSSAASRRCEDRGFKERVQRVDQVIAGSSEVA